MRGSRFKSARKASIAAALLLHAALDSGGDIADLETGRLSTL